MSGVKVRHVGIDAGRMIAFIAVVLIHTMGMQIRGDFGVSPEASLSFLARFAVPFYFLSAGYFLARKVDTPWSAIWTLFLRLSPIFLVWALLYEFMYGQGVAFLADPIAVVKFMVAPPQGYHLWFLPALGVSAAMMLLLLRCGSWGILWGVAGGFFVVSVLFSSYGAYVCGGIDCFNTRYGPFFGLLYVALGAWIGRGAAPQIRNGLAWAMVVFGLGVMLSEALILDRLGHTSFIKYEIGFGALPYSLGLFFVALNFDKDWRVAKWLAVCGPYVLGMYAIHVIFVHEVSGALPESLQYNVFGLLVISGIVIALSVVVALIGGRIPVLQRIFK